mmetsp:Transcript_23861/g.65551  ORF Transcript_23861/g.65551 Transcript_23861/m.65551 type:complete len:200 (+) Transcript_23861:441-1040(+)
MQQELVGGVLRLGGVRCQQAGQVGGLHRWGFAVACARPIQFHVVCVSCVAAGFLVRVGIWSWGCVLELGCCWGARMLGLWWGWAGGPCENPQQVSGTHAKTLQGGCGIRRDEGLFVQGQVHILGMHWDLLGDCFLCLLERKSSFQINPVKSARIAGEFQFNLHESDFTFFLIREKPLIFNKSSFLIIQRNNTHNVLRSW